MVDGAPRADAPAPAPASPPKGARQRRMANYMLDARVQLPYVLSVVVVVSALTVVLGGMLFNEATSATEQIVRSLHEFGDPAIQNEVAAALSSDDRRLLLLIGAAGFGLIIVLALYLVVMTHHVAGPLYKIGAYFDRLRDGKLPQVRDLRKGDHLHGFFEKFRTMEDALVERTERDARLIEQFLAAWDEGKGPVPRDVELKVATLRELMKLKQAALTNRPARLVTVPGPFMPPGGPGGPRSPG